MTTWHSVTPTLSADRHQTIHPSPNEATVTTPDNDESRPSALLDPQTTTAPMPTARTVALRTNLPLQAVRYGVVSLKMLRMVLKSHN